MGTLAAAYLAARSRRAGGALAVPFGLAGVDGHDSSSTTLEATLAVLAERGTAAHVDFQIDDVLFATHLGHCGAPIGLLPAAEIHAEDLFLAAAALFGEDEALAKLRRIHRPVLASCLRQFDVSTPFLDEVELLLWDSALVGRDGAPPKLASYAGDGALAVWVALAAQYIAHTMRQSDAAEQRPRDGSTAEADALAADPELAIIKGKLRGKFQGAVSRALGNLENRERMIYRLHLVDGMAIEMIAKVYRVSHSTISRWLVRARDSVMRETERLLREEMKLSPAEFESVTALVVSQIDLSVSRILRDPG